MVTFGLVILGVIVLIAVAAVVDVMRWTSRNRRMGGAQSAGEAMYQREAQLTKGRQTGLTVIVQKIDEREK